MLAGAAGLLVPRRAFAQPAARKYRVLVLHSVPIPSGPYHNVLRERLAAHGFIEGKNLILDAPVVSPVGIDWLRMQIAKHVVPPPDAIVAFTARMTDAAIAEAPKTPVVFAWVTDPVQAGIVKDYSRPGVNATGVSGQFVDVTVKRLELLRELAPRVKRVAVVGPTYQPDGAAAISALRAASPRLGFQLMEVSTGLGNQAIELQHAIRNGAEAVLPLYIYSAFGAKSTGEEVVRLCLAHRLAGIFAESEMVEIGGLISYGTSLIDEVRRAADMTVKIVRGIRPQEMPIDQVSNFELAVNLRTARQIKIRVPPAVLARADRVIE